jgi:hypothetical protein
MPFMVPSSGAGLCSRLMQVEPEQGQIVPFTEIDNA